MASNDDMTLAVHERRSRHYVTEGRGHSRFDSAVLGRVENHRKHQPLKVVLKIKKSRLITRKIRYYINISLIARRKKIITVSTANHHSL